MFNTKSGIENWHLQSTVHHQIKLLPISRDYLAFSPDLVPTSKHDLTLKLGREGQRRHQAYVALAYNEFTVWLEDDGIAPAALELATQPEAFGLSPDDALFCRCIIGDEAMHSLKAAHLRNAIVATLDVPPEVTPRPHFLWELERILASIDAEYRGCTRVVFANVSETLITDTLVKLPHDHRVDPNVRTIMHEHAIDEGRHNAFFRMVMKQSWDRWNADERQMYGPMYARFIRAFLQPDITMIERGLCAAGLTPDDAKKVIRECHTGESATAGLRHNARATLSVLNRIGVLDHAASRAALVAEGLID